MAEQLIDTRTTRSAHTVQVVRETGGYPHVLWRCTCGARSDWSTATDDAAPALAAARAHASTC